MPEAIPGANVRILGTDIDRRMVARAKAGAFTLDDARGAPGISMKRFFEPVPGRLAGQA